MEFLLLIIGFIILIKASDYFVDASINIAKTFKISEVVIGATIVSIGTTLPETMVSATSAFKGHSDISYGNAIGSIICNTALIAAVSLIFANGKVSKKALKTPILFFFTSFLVYAISAYVFKGFSRIAGIILVSIFVIYILYIIKNNMNKKTIDEVKGIAKDKLLDVNKEEGKVSSYYIFKLMVILIVSAAFIAFASNLLVDNGVIIARKFGVSEAVIGLTIIAFGTSLPELSTAVTSLIKGHSDLSLGNIIGADFFNIVTVTGVAAIITPFRLPNSKVIFSINSSLIVDLPLTLLVMLILCMPPFLSGKTYRKQGLSLLFIYILFLIYQLKI